MPHSRSLMYAATALFAVSLVAGCSQPADDTAPAAAEPTRDIRLAEPIVSEAVQVSDLEAGRTLTAGRASANRTPSRTAKARATPDAILALDRAPAVAVTATTASAPEMVEAPLAAAPKEEVVMVVGRGAEPMYTSNLDHGFGGTSPGRRDPTIIIRGGRGGVDDDCDLDRPGHGPVAINRVTGPVAGGIAIAGRSRGGVSFPRGIR